MSSEGERSGWVSQTLLAPLQVPSKMHSPPAPPPVLWGTTLSQQDLKATHPRPDRPNRPQPSQRRREPELPASTGSVLTSPLSAVFPSGIRLKPVSSWDPSPAWLLSLQL